ncbi:hypothetical protein H5U98_22355 [Mycolicibacterium boenickei]|uniref:ESX-1 secretion-associated protein n=1 Tax=Mycolicibacterium boenickei TaxID=146017 RepID=A0AAX3A9Q1_9MYCO|nr:hypothetical protein CQY21_02815 [Mycolicibacterium boenickei]UNC03101.1 hypothetical protein H5U98_22355 [Mycolicibacterium boenickei]
MRADLAAIRALGDALNAHSADLDAVAATLRSIPAPALGPIGERFAAAFAQAVSAHSDAVAALGIRTGAGAVNARNTAADYYSAGQRAAQLLPRV